MDEQDLLDLIPAYALGALDPEEHAEIEAWLKDNPDAQIKLSEYQVVADQLYLLAPPQSAPSHLEADLRQRLVSDRITLSHGKAVRATTYRWRRYYLAVVAAVFVLILGGFLVVGRLLEKNQPTAENPQQTYSDLIARDDANHYTLMPGVEGQTIAGELVASADGNKAALRVTQLPTIGTNQTFQLWMVEDNGAVVSGGLFRATLPENTAYVHIPLDESITTYRRMGVSIEPAGGSPYPDKPTGGNVFFVELDS